MIAQDFTQDAPRPAHRRASVSWSGPALVRSGRFEEALRAANRLLKVCPEHLGALEVAAQAYLYTGRAEDCLRFVRTLIRLNPHEPAYEGWRASAYQSLGRHIEALAALARAHRLYREESVKARVLTEMEFLVDQLQLGGREPTQIWAELGLAPPPRRRSCRDACPPLS